VVLDTSANRRVVTSHPATFAAAFPLRSLAVRAWLAAPEGSIAGLRFLPATKLVRTIQLLGGPVRVRRPTPAADELDPSVADGR
jgi:hypothetical protein